MPAKKLVYKAMVAMPAILLAGLGVKAHTEYDPFEFVSATPKENAQILAYKDVVLASKSVSSPMRRDKDPRALRSLAKMWVDGEQSGKLQQLDPVSYDDTCRDGVKGEIFQANENLATALNYTAGMEEQRRQYAAAASDSMLSMTVVNALKYSDFPTLVASTLAQRRSLRLMSDALPRLNGQDRASVISYLEANRPKLANLEHVESLEHLLFVEYLRRMGVEPTKIESDQPLSTSIEVVNGQVAGTLLASARDDTIPEGEELAKIARQGEADLTAQIDNVLKSQSRQSSL